MKGNPEIKKELSSSNVFTLELSHSVLALGQVSNIRIQRARGSRMAIENVEAINKQHLDP